MINDDSDHERFQLSIEELERAREAQAQIARLREESPEFSEQTTLFRKIADTFPIAALYLFSGRSLVNTDLRNCNLTGIDFRGSDLAGCVWDNAQIYGAQFALARVSRPALRKARDWSDHMRASREQCPPPRRPFSRLPGERFSLASHLPEMILLSAHLVPQHAANPGPERRLDGLWQEERKALLEGRLCIAIKPISMGEFEAVKAAPISEKLQLATLNSWQARLFIDNVNAEGVIPEGWVARIPSVTLLSILAKSALHEKMAHKADDTLLAPADLEIAEPKEGHPSPEFALDPVTEQMNTVSFPTNADRKAGNLNQGGAGSSFLRPVFFMPSGGSL